MNAKHFCSWVITESYGTVQHTGKFHIINESALAKCSKVCIMFRSAMAHTRIIPKLDLFFIPE